MSIERNEIKEMLQNIKTTLSLKATISEGMVTAWHRMLDRHKPNVILNATDALIDDWSHGYFPKPAEFRQYLTFVYNKEEEKKHSYTHDSRTLHELDARVKKLIDTSQRNIDALTKDTPKVKCARCDKWAIRNLKADDYFEYWEIPMEGYEKYKGAYLCSEHTKRLDDHLMGLKNKNRIT